MATSHVAEEIDGEFFAGGSEGTFLVVLVGPRNQSLIVDFGGLFLWPCINISRHKHRSYDMVTLAFVGNFLCGMRSRRFYQQNRKSIVQVWAEYHKLTLLVIWRTLKTFSGCT